MRRLHDAAGQERGSGAWGVVDRGAADSVMCIFGAGPGSPVENGGGRRS